MTTTIFFDESGYTGSDLLNADQPVFTVGSSTLEEGAAIEILRSSFPRYAAREFKFANIWARKGSRAGLARFAEEIGRIPDKFFVFHVDKRFAVLTKLVDFLIEPLAHESGVDFYSDRYAPKLCNMFKFGLDYYADPTLFVSVTNAYQAFARRPSLESLEDLHTTLSIMAGSVHDNIAMFFQMAVLGAEHFLRFHELDAHKASSDLQLTAVFASVGHWRRRLDDDFLIVHDESSNFFRKSEIWNAVSGPDAEGLTLTSADGHEVSLPLRVVGTQARASHASASIQACDVLAGLVARLKRHDNDPETEAFLREVLDVGLREVSGDGIGQAYDFPESHAPRLQGPDVIDKMINVMRKSSPRAGS